MEKVIYYFEGELENEPVKKFIDFINSVDSKELSLDFYISSYGGGMDAYNALKSILENNHFKEVTVYNGYFVGSFAFFLFYFLENVNKVLLPDCFGLIHSISLEYSDRELKNPNGLMAKRKENTDRLNEKFLARLQENKVLTPKEVIKFNNGEDIDIYYDRFISIMKKCPY